MNEYPLAPVQPGKDEVTELNEYLQLTPVQPAENNIVTHSYVEIPKPRDQSPTPEENIIIPREITCDSEPLVYTQ